MVYEVSVSQNVCLKKKKTEAGTHNTFSFPPQLQQSPRQPVRRQPVCEHTISVKLLIVDVFQN